MRRRRYHRAAAHRPGEVPRCARPLPLRHPFAVHAPHGKQGSSSDAGAIRDASTSSLDRDARSPRNCAPRAAAPQLSRPGPAERKWCRCGAALEPCGSRPIASAAARSAPPSRSPAAAAAGVPGAAVQAALCAAAVGGLLLQGLHLRHHRRALAGGGLQHGRLLAQDEHRHRAAHGALHLGRAAAARGGPLQVPAVGSCAPGRSPHPAPAAWEPLACCSVRMPPAAALPQGSQAGQEQVWSSNAAVASAFSSQFVSTNVEVSQQAESARRQIGARRPRWARGL
jgi:hypothetical protein